MLTDAQFAIVAQHMGIAAVWADCEEGSHPQLTHSSLKSLEKMARAFYAKHSGVCDVILAAEDYGSHPDAGSPEAAFGHDLYLTAAGHGTGFWDREELPEKERDQVSDILRRDHREWYIETWQSRGWFYAQWAGDIKK